MPLLPAFLTTSLDDVVFEGRNQAYGAYQLRQDYKQHLASAGGFTLGLCSLLLLSWLAWQHLVPAAANLPTKPLNPVELAPVYVAQLPKQLPVAPPHQAPAAPHHRVATLPTQVVSDKTPLPAPKPTLSEPVEDGPASLTASPSTTEVIGPGLVDAGPGAANTTSTAPAITGPYIVVEKMPEFAGGQAALLRYLQKNLRYPAAALAAQAEGRVFLSFVVQADGSISEVTILKGLGYGLDEEATRVVRQMPAWTPGYQSKHAVPVRFTLPITFKVQ